MSAVAAVKRKPGRPKKTEPDFAKVKRAGKSRAKEPAGDEQPAKPERVKAANTAELLKGVVVLEEKDVPLREINRSTHNPRTDFDQVLIDEMAATIETTCQLNPLTVRETTYEVIDGETRHRAGEVGKAKSLRCKIVRCTDAQAALLRMLSTLKRRDLNPIDRARGIKALLDSHGLSQRQMKDMLGIEQGTISNLVRLLDLPEQWQQRVISGEITAKTAREICPYADEPAVLDALAAKLDDLEKDERNHALTENLWRSVRDFSRPLTNHHFYDSRTGKPRYVDLKPTDEQRTLLRVRLARFFDNEEERCFNVDLWEELQKAAEDLAEEKAEKKAAKQKAKSKSNAAAGTVDPKKEAENAARQEQILSKKLYRYRVGWYQDRLVESIEKASHATLMTYCAWLACRGDGYRVEDLESLLHPGYHERAHGMKADQKYLGKLLELDEARAWVIARGFVSVSFNKPFDTSSPAIAPWMIEQFATSAGVDLKKDWPKTCKNAEAKPDYLTGYLDLLNKDQLVDQIAEWDLSIEFTGSTKRSALIELVAAAARGKPAPKALIDAENVCLS